jgi:hypothetical protein
MSEMLQMGYLKDEILDVSPTTSTRPAAAAGEPRPCGGCGPAGPSPLHLFRGAKARRRGGRAVQRGAGGSRSGRVGSTAPCGLQLGAGGGLA